MLLLRIFAQKSLIRIQIVMSPCSSAALLLRNGTQLTPAIALVVHQSARQYQISKFHYHNAKDSMLCPPSIDAADEYLLPIDERPVRAGDASAERRSLATGGASLNRLTGALPSSSTSTIIQTPTLPFLPSSGVQ
jgi:hypothetical protein